MTGLLLHWPPELYEGLAGREPASPGSDGYHGSPQKFLQAMPQQRSSSQEDYHSDDVPHYMKPKVIPAVRLQQPLEQPQQHPQQSMPQQQQQQMIPQRLAQQPLQQQIPQHVPQHFPQTYAPAQHYVQASPAAAAAVSVPVGVSVAP